eukprot:7230353-Alexandrium_andersonii.AAC.1
MRNRVWKEWKAGEVCFYWRRGKGQGNKLGQKGSWHGPAVVLSQETRVENGVPKTTSSVWVVHGAQLLRCAAEQLRPSSVAEKEIMALSGQWTEFEKFEDVAKVLPAGSYQDVSGDAVDREEMDWDGPAQDVPAPEDPGGLVDPGPPPGLNLEL